MLTKKNFLHLFLLISVSLLTACGFHLRGQINLPPPLRYIYLESYNSSSPLTIQLQEALKAANITVADSAKAAPITLQILDDEFRQQLTSISSNTQVRTYTISYVINFQIKNRQEKILMGPQQIQSISSFATSDNQLLADNSVLPMQRNQMIQDAIQQLFNRLSAKELVAKLR